MLPLMVAIMNIGTAFPGFLGRNPADVLTLSAYRIILPVLWRHPELFLKTDLGRHLAWLIRTELLELPVEAEGRISRKDALAEALFAEPVVDRTLHEALAALGRRAAEPGFRSRLEEALTAYAGSRAAAA